MTRRAAKPRPAPPQDHGSEGPAMLCRPSRMVETITAGVTARQMEDEHLVDRLHRVAQLTDDQHAAAVRLLEMCGAAGLLPGASAPYGRVAKAAEMSDAMAEARAAWNRTLRGLGSQRAQIVEALVIDEQHPGVRYLATLQATLDMLARRWGIEG